MLLGVLEAGGGWVWGWGSGGRYQVIDVTRTLFSFLTVMLTRTVTSTI